MGTRSTLLDARPQDYSSSGYIDWPFMTTHNWGENPRGRWVLEIHNDAYSKWASDAKFFKWSLELYGIRYDPNSQEYIEAQAEKNNNVREAPVIPPSIMMMPGFVSNKNTTTTTSTTTTTTTELTSSTTTSTTTEYIPRGCVSKRSECTQKVKECRTFVHRSVAQVFCRCSTICFEIASILDLDSDESFNMQCYAKSTSSKEPRSLKSTSDTPFYCQFIPFFSYN